MKNILEILEQRQEDATYPIPPNAQPEIKQALERFNNLPEQERRKQVPLWWMLGASTEEYKMYKGIAEYTDQSEIENQVCGNCKFIWVDAVDGSTICSQVRGKIEKSGWCKLWRKA